MFKYLKNIDTFSKNIILVFLGTSLLNFFNLLYQLLLAHRLMPSDFAAFNTLLSIFMVFSIPLGTLQAAVAKYSAEFKAQGKIEKIRVLLSGFLKKTFILAVGTFFILYLVSLYILDKLKIHSFACSYILSILLASSWVIPVLSGGLQGLELFKWLASISVITGALKLILAFIFVMLGFKIAGALGAFFISTLIGLIISYLPLKDFISFRPLQNGVNFKEIFLYLFPVAISLFCFTNLISLDMILVKYYFSPSDAGLYSLAQMVGKIFLFLPGAISIVMFPKVSGLSAQNMDTLSTLKKSLCYAGILCMIAILGYNIFPSLILKILTGKVFSESILLGRLFSISMSFFTLLNILIAYFLSLRDLRFIKYLFSFTLLQVLAIVFIHGNLLQIQLVLCLNAILLFFIHLILVYKKGLSPLKL